MRRGAGVWRPRVRRWRRRRARAHGGGGPAHWRNELGLPLRLPLELLFATRILVLNLVLALTRLLVLLRLLSLSHLIAHARPNGSCLSCGRLARRRKGAGRQSVPR